MTAISIQKNKNQKWNKEKCIYSGDLNISASFIFSATSTTYSACSWAAREMKLNDPSSF